MMPQGHDAGDQTHVEELQSKEDLVMVVQQLPVHRQEDWLIYLIRPLSLNP